MPSQTDIANLALHSINAAPINHLDDADAKSAACKLFFNEAVAVLMDKDHWHFAQARVSMAALPDSPTSEWTYQYTLPADCARPIRINDDDKQEWEVENGVLLTDAESPIILEYVSRGTDPNRWDGTFREAFTHYIAHSYGKVFKADKDKIAGEFQQYQMALAEAMARNGQTGSVLRPTVDTLLVVRRY